MVKFKCRLKILWFVAKLRSNEYATGHLSHNLGEDAVNVYRSPIVSLRYVSVHRDVDFVHDSRIQKCYGELRKQKISSM